MAATFGGVRRVFSRRELSAVSIYSLWERIENVFPNGPPFEYHLITICLPGILIALVVLALYVKERNKKL